MGKKPTTVTNSFSSSSRDNTYLKAVIDKRTRLFESIQADHLARRQTIASQSIKITFPDWSVKEGMQWVMSPMDVAKEISPVLAVSAMNAKVRKEFADAEAICEDKIKRVSAKYELVSGDVILLPITVQKDKSEIKDHSGSVDEVDFIQSLVLYKDPAIVVVNKPPGMPVQGGVGIKHCMDKLAAMFLKYECLEPPRLVHRLDRDSSGILVLGRTQSSATILHSIFREKTSGVGIKDLDIVRRVLQKKYWALVIGSPRHLKGRICAPLAKIVLEDGKSERITIARDESTPAQHALTEYKVIKSAHGFSWLELQPLTGRKHQIRVHCAEALGTPIVGDFKYGWKAHRNWEPVMPREKPTNEPESNLPFGLQSGGGSVCEKQPRLHLHCRQMVLPDISSTMKHLESSSSSSLNLDLSKLEMLDLVAPIPAYMKESWEVLNC